MVVVKYVNIINISLYVRSVAEVDYVNPNGARHIVIANTKDTVCYATSISSLIGLFLETIKPRRGQSWNMSYNSSHLKGILGLQTNESTMDVPTSVLICSWT